MICLGMKQSITKKEQPHTLLITYTEVITCKKESHSSVSWTSGNKTGRSQLFDH